MSYQLSPTDRMMKVLQASTHTLAAIDSILMGGPPSEPAFTGPLLYKMTDGAKYLGVSRSTLWRLIKSGNIQALEIRPGTLRVRRFDLERFAGLRP